ncbi:MAG: hypothetical protein J6F30_18250 [Cellulosilyticum sp.]|nr:hypothetical protein [Cellulosilyticum sp.]
MTKKEIKRFLELHPDKPISAAKFEYSWYLMPEASEIANTILEETIKKTEEDLMYETKIAKIDNPEELLHLMRKKLSGLNRSALRKKILEYEEGMLPLIQRKALTSMQDIFIENTLHFLLHSKVNECKWIIDNYQVFKSEYLKSMLCLVLGFRGDKSLIPMMMKETERFERYYPEESYEQAPLLAIQELAVRFYN